MYEFNMLSTNKLEHCNSVAKVMYYLAKNCLKADEDTCNEMATLGMVHDIGYMFNYDSTKHPISGSKSIPGYKYAAEIEYHGKVDKADYSLPLKLLNFADLHVDYRGNIVSTEKRLTDIMYRYGAGSRQFQNASSLAKIIHNDVWEKELKYIKEI